ncbi:hypothetical protein PVAND_016037 [Polypedilum vanderplanki]|uniref:Uncharacterized protein n=1 Tax=Polypedilum vanderplanki TaxID=319348 RepID=A0A9J6BEF8_POLVA|nr:hypothetical protein PVAND_016037 [Polypedilum vanderplanki]
MKSNFLTFIFVITIASVKCGGDDFWLEEVEQFPKPETELSTKPDDNSINFAGKFEDFMDALFNGTQEEVKKYAELVKEFIDENQELSSSIQSNIVKKHKCESTKKYKNS